MTDVQKTVARCRAEYVTGNMSLKEIANVRGVSAKTLFRASRDEGWAQLRKDYRKRLASDTADLKLKCDTAVFKMVAESSVRLLRLIDEVSADPDGLRRYVAVETEKDGSEMSSRMVERTFRRVDAAQLKQLADSQKSLVDGLYKLYGIPTQAEKASQKLAAERLQLERDKFEADRAKDSTEEITVRMELPEGFDA